MNTRIKKGLAMTMAMAMAMSTMTGCGPKSSEVESKGTEQDTTAAVQTEQQTTEAAALEESTAVQEETAAVMQFQLGSSSYALKVPEGYKMGEMSAEDLADDQVGYYHREDGEIDFDVYQFAKADETADSLEAYAKEEAAQYGVAEDAVESREINGTAFFFYRAEEEFEGTKYTTHNYLFEEGEDYFEVVLWLDGDDAETKAEALISSFAEMETMPLELGGSNYTITVPVNYKEGELTAEDLEDNQVAYYQNESTLLDFDVYEFPKAEEKEQELEAYAKLEASEYTTEDVYLQEINGIATAIYLASEESEGNTYRTMTCIMEDGENFVEVVFWLDGPAAEKQAGRIIGSLANIKTVPLQLGESAYTITIPEGYMEGQISEADLKDGQTGYYSSKYSLLDFDVYEFPKAEEKETELAAYAAMEAAEYQGSEVTTQEINGITVMSYLAVEENNGVKYDTCTCIMEDGENFVEIVFWLDGAAAKAQAATILQTLTK